MYSAFYELTDDYNTPSEYAFCLCKNVTVLLKTYKDEINQQVMDI